ncbi:3'(2'),5'-bisphosphate nucleotidase CysQ [Saccharicrinis fermentans]|uniref:3'(2'),5'-bisphosphate nucleotidase CysQ n=1 Tax=Saccharicrinis fermentans DSM 9555 = JCM 21142 TaxID=869213 RepID=W7XVC4_9BACT|nr:3'(2'),5'-bisphosphate nucleotidase CysQ [Saccharicrinis fermentans]GAF02050.1 3'(2'),5'-bisphosphate nucleotidase CysQ [Saccharicrinis fermentans DSM 9555 = JCM 21142]
MQKLLKLAIDAAVEAGQAIMKIYKSGDLGVEFKADNSPLTLADKAAHQVIEKYLLTSHIPILSEEGRHEDYLLRKDWKRLWIVDPLDGTKEFVKRTGEFTVNIALVEDHYPIMGVVLLPALGILYFASADDGAYKVVLAQDWLSQTQVSISDKEKLPIVMPHDQLQIVASVSHLSKETELFAAQLKTKYGDSDFVSVGSSIKICKVAEGTADIYPRLGPTMEWDTAAGQAVAEAAGAYFTNWKTKARLGYNRKVLLNDWFVVSGKRFSLAEIEGMISDFEEDN